MMRSTLGFTIQKETFFISKSIASQAERMFSILKSVRFPMREGLILEIFSSIGFSQSISKRQLDCSKKKPLKKGLWTLFTFFRSASARAAAPAFFVFIHELFLLVA